MPSLSGGLSIVGDTPYGVIFSEFRASDQRSMHSGKKDLPVVHGESGCLNALRCLDAVSPSRLSPLGKCS